jgi:hypothetical protein
MVYIEEEVVEEPLNLLENLQVYSSYIILNQE